MLESKVQAYSNQLKDLGIEHQYIEHPEFKSPEVLQLYLHDSLAGACPTLIMKADRDFVAIVKRGDTRLNSAKIKKILNVSSLRLATAEEFTRLTGLPIGAARVLNPNLLTLLDRHLFDQEYLNGGTGSFTFTFKYKTKDLVKIPKSMVVDIADQNVSPSSPQRVFSGTRATGRLHLGNYLGAVKGYIELQNNPDFECIYMAVDLHTVTTPYHPQTLAQATRDIIMDYLAAGLDPQKAIITAQSLVPEHTYLAFLLASVISVARMQHLPTFKDKIKQFPDHVTMALLNYPVLMAADILIYKASHIPTGIDQEPHLEIAREIARKMNELYGTDFPEPVRFATKGEYVPSLSGVGKMSKSVEGSYINLTDNLEIINKKLSTAPTDSGKGERVPLEGGVANLLKLVELFEGSAKRRYFSEAYTHAGIRYGDLKHELAHAIYQELKPIQEKRRQLEMKPDYVNEIIHAGAKKAQAIAGSTLEEVKLKMGFLA